MTGARTPRVLALLALTLAGCGADDPALTVATAWTAPERAGLDDAIRRAGVGPVRWVLLAPGDDPAAVARRRNPPDLIVGGAAAAYQTMERRGLLDRGEAGSPAWRVARRSALGRAYTSRPAIAGYPGLEFTWAGSYLMFNDPRRDALSMAWAEAVLAGEPTWDQGYARLIGYAGGRVEPGRQPGAALAAVARGEALSAPAFAPAGRSTDGHSSSFWPEENWPAWVEGAAVVRGARHAEAAHTLLREITPDHDEVPPSDPSADELLADLLGATLVDARDELRAAWGALNRAGRPPKAAAWMTQPPPWPPASVARILSRDGNAMPLLETLARQIAPEADVRAWLLRSWLAPGRAVDGRLLAELAAAERGRLAGEPRFRAWLRAEWTAWARQRYRRVARLSASDPGVPAS